MKYIGFKHQRENKQNSDKINMPDKQKEPPWSPPIARSILFLANFKRDQ
jgi:hypothetical protein